MTLLAFLLVAGLAVPILVQGPASADPAFSVAAPWDAGKTFAVGSPGGQVGGGYYGHCCVGYSSEYYAVDINGPGGAQADCGETVRATNSGRVSAVGNYSGGIAFVRIDHSAVATGYASEYQHLRTPLSVTVGQEVSRGEPIGQVWNTGTTYCHLHFLVKKNGSSVAPSPMSGVPLPSNVSGVWVTSDNNFVGGRVPSGNFESIRQVPGGVLLTGWALDPDTTAPIQIHVYEGLCCANPRGAFVADQTRPDVGAAFPGYGDRHGFSIVIGVAAGTTGSKTYCPYAINVGAGAASPSLGCRSVTFSWNPSGNFESIRQVPGGVLLTGWALDPDTTAPIQIHVYEGSCCANPRGAFVADQTRPDVGAAFPGYGDRHGFSIVIGVAAGTTGNKTYCPYAINTGVGSASPSLGCRVVTLS